MLKRTLPSRPSTAHSSQPSQKIWESISDKWKYLRTLPGENLVSDIEDYYEQNAALSSMLNDLRQSNQLFNGHSFQRMALEQRIQQLIDKLDPTVLKDMELENGHPFMILYQKSRPSSAHYSTPSLPTDIHNGNLKEVLSQELESLKLEHAALEAELEREYQDRLSVKDLKKLNDQLETAIQIQQLPKLTQIQAFIQETPDILNQAEKELLELESPLTFSTMVPRPPDKPKIQRPPFLYKKS